jgi:hypothetical protein
VLSNDFDNETVAATAASRYQQIMVGFRLPKNPEFKLKSTDKTAAS